MKLLHVPYPRVNVRSDAVKGESYCDWISSKSTWLNLDHISYITEFLDHDRVAHVQVDMGGAGPVTFQASAEQFMAYIRDMAG